MIESILALGLLLAGVPGDDAAASVPKKQEEKPAEPPPPAPLEAPALKLEDEGLPWIDFDWVELEPRLGVGIFSSGYKMDPSPFISLLTHVPLTLLTPSSDPGGEYFGLFAEVNFFPSVTRDLDPEPDKVSGSLLFLNLGVDFTFLRNQSFYLAARAGFQYALYGGISDLNDGFGFMAGAEGGIYLGKSLTLTLGPEVAFGDGDNVILTSLGLLIEF
jgi:hypothetical protein